MKRSSAPFLWLFFALLSLNSTSLVAQILIADYPLTENSLDQTGHFGPITYGINGTPPPSAACANGSNYGTFQTPVLSSLFNKSNFQIDLDFTSNGSTHRMPVWMIGPSYRTIGVYISEAGKIGIKYNNSNYIFSNSTITIGTSIHISLKYVEPNFWLFWNNTSIPLLTQALPPLEFAPGSSDILFLPEDRSNAAIFNGCITNLKIYSACLVTFSSTHFDATCNLSNGSITVNASGGSGSYQYSKDNGVSFQDQSVFSDLAAGTYQIVVQDKGGAQCKSEVQEVTVAQTGSDLQSTVTTTPTDCDQNNGKITIIASGGSGSYEYSINRGLTSFQDNNVFTGLRSGIYNVVVKDKEGAQCVTGSRLVVLSRTGLVQFTTTKADASCNQSNGSITVSATGGTGSYQYSKDSGANFQSDNVFSRLAAGTYQIVVQDQRGLACKSNVEKVVIAQSGSDLQVTATPKNASCNQPNGTITVSATGGSGSYQYSKDNGTSFQDDKVFSGLEAATYQVVVRDKGGAHCKSDVKEITINQTGSVQVTSTHTNATCNQPNGSITISAAGGSGSYQYSIDNGNSFQETNVFSGLGAKTYQLVVQDKGGAQCKSDVKEVAITQSGSNLTVTSTYTDATCNQSNGSITVSAAGGSGSYQYSINNGISFQETNVFSTLAAKTYEVVVQDKGGAQCKSEVKEVAITQIGSNLTVTSTHTDVTCDQSNGSITVNAAGGSGSYRYSINNGNSFQETNVFSGLATKAYQVVVQDKGGAQCKSEVKEEIITQTNFKPKVTATFTVATCDQSDGSIVLAAEGGTGSYRYSIDNGATFKDDNVFSGLAAKTYQVVVQDNEGVQCKSDVQEIKITSRGVGVIYSDVTVTAGKPYVLTARPEIGYKYEWSPTAGLDDPTSRTPTVKTTTDQLYQITITDASNCVTIDQQKVLVAKVTTGTGGSKDSVVAVPTAFTPNNNGVNDRLKPIPYGIDKLNYFKVYNRWGQLVFETKTVGEGWDGILKGKPQPAETYTWILECVTLNGATIRQSGRSLLIR